MVTLTIDGRTVQAQEGNRVVEASDRADGGLPNTCY